jgi:hypothetical protein
MGIQWKDVSTDERGQIDGQINRQTNRQMNRHIGAKPFHRLALSSTHTKFFYVRESKSSACIVDYKTRTD